MSKIAEMATDTAPLTRTDLREELDRTLQHYASKADLERLRGDVREGLKDLEVKLTARLIGAIALATGVIIAVDRLAT